MPLSGGRIGAFGFVPGTGNEANYNNPAKMLVHPQYPGLLYISDRTGVRIMCKYYIITCVLCWSLKVKLYQIIFPTSIYQIFELDKDTSQSQSYTRFTVYPSMAWCQLQLQFYFWCQLELERCQFQFLIFVSIRFPDASAANCRSINSDVGWVVYDCNH